MFGFSWVVEGKLAGMGRPGPPFADLEEDLRLLDEVGVGAVVSLTEDPLDEAVILDAGLNVLHLPVPDMTPPGLDTVMRFVAFVESALGAGQAVAVHCAMGQGRTGTMLACYLVHTGNSAAEAIRTVRTMRPGSIETREQEATVFAYARHLDEVES
ncbi:MAG: dual specificity protein phosphatase 23 [bacterium]|nr:dual specificity protein phosphatase 23 [bacterium]